MWWYLLWSSLLLLCVFYACAWGSVAWQRRRMLWICVGRPLLMALRPPPWHCWSLWQKNSLACVLGILCGLVLLPRMGGREQPPRPVPAQTLREERGAGTVVSSGSPIVTTPTLRGTTATALTGTATAASGMQAAPTCSAGSYLTALTAENMLTCATPALTGDLTTRATTVPSAVTAQAMATGTMATGTIVSSLAPTLAAIAAPATPRAGTRALYRDRVTNIWMIKDADGVIRALP